MKQAKQELLRATLISVAVLSIAGFILGLGSFVAEAWTPPAGSPPTGGDIAAPLNVSNSAQLKIGPVTVDPTDTQGVVTQNSLSIYGNNANSSLYVEQSGGGWATILSGDVHVGPFAGGGQLCLNSGYTKGVAVPECITSWAEVGGGGSTLWQETGNFLHPLNTPKSVAADAHIISGYSAGGDIRVWRDGACNDGECRALVNPRGILSNNYNDYLIINYDDAGLGLGDYDKGVLIPGKLNVGGIQGVPATDMTTASFFSTSQSSIINPDSAIYAQQNDPVEGWAGFFSGDVAISGGLYMTGSVYAVEGDLNASRGGGGKLGKLFAGNFNGNVYVGNETQDAELCLNGTDDGANCIQSFIPDAFQCNRGTGSCGVAAQSSCNDKCQNATDPGPGFCVSAWVENKGLQNFNCDDTATPVGTIYCNCLRFD
ncbi:MAG: hypothetical protein ABIB97_02685 [Patescibacteria group bacterium]